jgi:hypothetical protein
VIDLFPLPNAIAITVKKNVAKERLIRLKLF